MQAIYILWLRQIKRYFRSKSRIVGSVGQPILFLVALGFGFGPTFAKAGEGDYFTFLAPGIIAMTILFSSIFTGIDIIWDRQFGFLKETLVAPVARWKIMLGRTLGGATTSLMQGCLVLLITLVFGFHPNFAFLPLSLIVMILIAVIFTALGTVIASFIKDMQAFPLIMNFLVMPLFFLSGALFPVDGLGETFKIILAFNPLAYGVDGLRSSLTNISYFGLGTDLLVLSLIAVVFLAIGSYFFSKIEA